MNLEELRSVQRAERQKDSLQHLRDSFYEDVAGYIRQLKDERERAVAAADDPFASEDVRQLTDEIESTREIANALYERRVGKVVKHASFAAADMATDEEGMTTEERELFEDLVARIRRNRETVMSTLDGTARGEPADSPTEGDGSAASAPTSEAPASTADAADDLLADALGDADGVAGGDGTDAPPAPPDTPSSASATETNAPESTGTDSESTGTDSESTRPTEEAAFVSDEDAGGTADAADAADSPTETPADTATGTRSEPTAASREATERTTLRITADVGTVYGVDEREYDLARDDVVMLPTTNAEPLIRKDAAERID